MNKDESGGGGPLPEPTAAALAELAEVRARPAYHLACIYLERVLASSERPKTRGLLVGVESVVVLMRGSFGARPRPAITAALADPELGLAVMFALVDRGFDVAECTQRWCPGQHVACNVRESALWEFFYSARPATL